MMVKERERQRELLGIGASEARAAEHHVDPVHAHVRPYAVPKKLERALGAIGRQDA